MTAKPETHGLKRYRITTTSTNPFGYDAKVKVKVYLASEADAVIAEKDAHIAQLQKYCDYLVSIHAAREQEKQT